MGVSQDMCQSQLHATAVFSLNFLATLPVCLASGTVIFWPNRMPQLYGFSQVGKNFLVALLFFFSNTIST